MRIAPYSLLWQRLAEHELNLGFHREYGGAARESDPSADVRSTTRARFLPRAATNLWLFFLPYAAVVIYWTSMLVLTAGGIRASGKPDTLARRLT